MFGRHFAGVLVALAWLAMLMLRGLALVVLSSPVLITAWLLHWIA